MSSELEHNIRFEVDNRDCCLINQDHLYFGIYIYIYIMDIMDIIDGTDDCFDEDRYEMLQHIISTYSNCKTKPIHIKHFTYECTIM